MKKAVGKALKVSGIILVALVVLAAALALLVLFDKPLVRNIIRWQLNRGLGTTVRLGRLDYSLFPLRVAVTAVELEQEDAFQKISLSLDRVEASGEFWKLLRGAKPAFDSMTVDGVHFRFDQKAVSEEPVDVEAMLLQASDALAWTKTLRIRNAGLSAGLVAGQAELDHVDLALTPGPARDAIAFAIGRADVRVKDRDGAFGLMTGLSSSGTLTLAAPFSADARFVFNSPRLASRGIETSLPGLTVAVAGRFDRSAQELSVSRLKLDCPGLLDIEGLFVGRLGYSLFLEAQGRAEIASLEAAAALSGPWLPPEFRAAKLRGRVELAGKYGFQRSSGETKDNLSASLSLDDVTLDRAIGGMPFRLRAAGRIDVAGPSQNPRLSADIRSSLGKIVAAGLAVSGSELHVVATATKSAVAVSLLDARLAGLVFEAAPGKTLAFERAALTGSASLDLIRRNAVLNSVEARLPGLAPLRLSGRLGFGKGGTTDLRFETRGLDISAVRAAAAPLIPAGIAGWEFGGTADLRLACRWRTASGDWGASGTIALAEAKFNDPTFTIAGESLDPAFRFDAVSARGKGLSFTGALDVNRGESLWKAVYVSWVRHPLKLTVSGRYDHASGAVEGLVAHALLPEIGTIDATGTAKISPTPAFDLRAGAALSLGPLYALYSQAGVSEESRLRLEGRLGADVRLRKDNGALSVAGRVNLADSSLEIPLTKTLIAGISADLPVHFESASNPADASEAPLPEAGSFRIQELSSPFLPLRSLDIPIRSGTNALGIEPLGLDLFGGRLELGRTTFRYDPAHGSFQGVGSLVLRDLDIARFPIASPQFKLTGKVRAEFPRLDIGPRFVAISGRGEADVFGGQIVLRDLAVSDPFMPGRAVSLNVDLVDLDLKKLTDEIPFGEVTGIVRGEIRNLVISYGQPARFDFRLDSVPHRGVPQTFSLKAVDNLTVLSSGQQASAGAGGFWMRFVRGFRYEKLGIVSTLRNDTFTLNGTIHEGGVEYLVKKPTLFGISVVNREPGKRISFKEMTGRLKRVGQSNR